MRKLTAFLAGLLLLLSYSCGGGSSSSSPSPTATNTTNSSQTTVSNSSQSTVSNWQQLINTQAQALIASYKGFFVDRPFFILSVTGISRALIASITNSTSNSSSFIACSNGGYLFTYADSNNITAGFNNCSLSNDTGINLTLNGTLWISLNATSTGTTAYINLGNFRFTLPSYPVEGDFQSGNCSFYKPANESLEVLNCQLDSANFTSESSFIYINSTQSYRNVKIYYDNIDGYAWGLRASYQTNMPPCVKDELYTNLLSAYYYGNQTSISTFANSTVLGIFNSTSTRIYLKDYLLYSGNGSIDSYISYLNSTIISCPWSY